MKLIVHGYCSDSSHGEKPWTFVKKFKILLWNLFTVATSSINGHGEIEKLHADTGSKKKDQGFYPSLFSLSPAHNFYKNNHPRKERRLAAYETT